MKQAKQRTITEYFEVCADCGSSFKTSKNSKETLCPKHRMAKQDIKSLERAAERERGENQRVAFLIGAVITEIQMCGSGNYADSDELEVIIVETQNGREVKFFVDGFAGGHIEWAIQ